MSSWWWVSPHFKNEKLQSGKLEDKIDVLEDQVIGVLDQAQWLTQQYPDRQQSGIPVLMLVSSYFEQIASYLRGEESKSRSAQFFREGLLAVFTNLESTVRQGGVARVRAAIDNIASTLYAEVRCGLFHEAMIRNRILLSEEPAPLGVLVDKPTGAVETVVIDPFKLLLKVRGHFEDYVKRLRDPGEITLRANFETFWNLRMGRKLATLPPA